LVRGRQGTARGRGERERKRECLVRESTFVWRVLAAEWERNGGAMTRKKMAVRVGRREKVKKREERWGCGA
jgi:hypothetical protein